MTMTLIETKTLGTAAASIEFTSIPQDATDLLFLSSIRTTEASTFTNTLVRFNGSTSGLSALVLYGRSSVAETTGGVARFIGHAPGASTTSNTFGNFSLYIPNYSGATNKSYSADAVSENNATGDLSALQSITAGLWSNTSAITSVLIEASSGNLAIGSTISLYKITKGSSSVVVS